MSNPKVEEVDSDSSSEGAPELENVDKSGQVGLSSGMLGLLRTDVYDVVVPASRGRLSLCRRVLVLRLGESSFREEEERREVYEEIQIFNSFQDDTSKQNRAEKKTRKAVAKMGLKPVPGIVRVTVRGWETVGVGRESCDLCLQKFREQNVSAFNHVCISRAGEAKNSG